MKGASDAVEYTPTDDFEEFNKDFDIDIADDKELWLFHWPLNSAPDINGKTLSLKLHNNAIVGTCEANGKQYEVLSTENRKYGATVFLPSSSDCQIVGVKARQVSLMHYPDPKELLESNQSAYKKMAERSAAASSMRSRSSRSGRTGTVVTGGSGDTPLRRHAGKRVRSIDLSLEDSRRESDSGAPSGSLEQSQERKSKKKRKLEA